MCGPRCNKQLCFNSYIGDNEAGRTVVPLIYLSDDNAFPRLCHLEATESIAFIKKKENSYYETKERKRNLKRLSIAFLLFQEKSPTMMIWNFHPMIHRKWKLRETSTILLFYNRYRMCYQWNCARVQAQKKHNGTETKPRAKMIVIFLIRNGILFV